MIVRRLLFTSILSLFITLTAYGQIVIGEADIRNFFDNHVVETYVADDVSSLLPLIDLDGPGQTFDLTSATFTLDGSYFVEQVSCSSAIAGCEDEHLGAANHIYRMRQADSAFVMFQNIDAGGVSILGSAIRYETPEEERPYLEELGIDPDIDSLTFATRFVPAMLELELPLTEGSSWAGSSQIRMVIVEGDLDLEDDIQMTIARSSEVDGWGTLVTPHGSAPALRYRTQNVSSTSFMGFEFSDTTYSITYISADGLQAEIDIDSSGEITEVSYTRLATSVSTQPAAELPASLHLHQNYPNPFNPSTTIAFEAAQPETIRLAVFDALGRQMSVLHEGHVPAGRHEFVWSGESFPSGSYLVRVETETGSTSRSMILLK